MPSFGMRKKGTSLGGLYFFESHVDIEDKKILTILFILVSHSFSCNIVLLSLFSSYYPFPKLIS